jgi:hypothetical protein
LAAGIGARVIGLWVGASRAGGEPGLDVLGRGAAAADGLGAGLRSGNPGDFVSAGFTFFDSSRLLAGFVSGIIILLVNEPINQSMSKSPIQKTRGSLVNW